MRRVLISGYYGFGNLGDEAILAATVAMFRERAPDVQLVALSADPMTTRQLHGVHAVPRWGVDRLWRGLKESDLFLLGGGGLFQDVTSWRSPLYYAGQLWAARMAGTPAMLWAHGIGPLHRLVVRGAVGLAVKGVRVATVRDADSVMALGRLGLAPEHIRLTADPVLALAPHDPQRAEALLEGAGLEPRRPFIAVAIRPWRTWFERQLKSFSAIVAQLATMNGLQVLVIPFQQGVDRFLSDEAAYCIGCRPKSGAPRVAVLQAPVTAPEMMALLGRSELVIGMRLHSLIMAAAMGVPGVGIVYDPKVEAFAKLAGYPTVPSVTALSEGDTWARVLLDAWESLDAQRKYLAKQVPLLRAAAWNNVDIALSLLGR